MSLFDHIKKKPDVKDEPNKNQPAVDVAAAHESDNTDTFTPDNQAFNTEPENQQFDTMSAENWSESADSSDNRHQGSPSRHRAFSSQTLLGRYRFRHDPLRFILRRHY